MLAWIDWLLDCGWVPISSDHLITLCFFIKISSLSTYSC
jgi:hypothetical protein